MKLLVVSDIHGRYDRLIRVIQMHRDADALVFLGDGLRDLERADVDSYGFTVFAVKGNCDGTSFLHPEADPPAELCFTLGGFRFFALHGHTKGVKSGTNMAIYAAMEREADVLLYGHTHIPEEKYLRAEIVGYSKPLRIFNPGSLGNSQDGRGHFGLIQVSGENLLMSHGSIL